MSTQRQTYFQAGTDGQLDHKLTMAVLRAEGVAKPPRPFHLNNDNHVLWDECYSGRRSLLE
jgi:hypothetical protein